MREPRRARTHEEVVGVGVGTANLEQLHQVVELAVDISAHGDGAFLAGSALMPPRARIRDIQGGSRE